MASSSISEILEDINQDQHKRQNGFAWCMLRFITVRVLQLMILEGYNQQTMTWEYCLFPHRPWKIAVTRALWYKLDLFSILAGCTHTIDAWRDAFYPVKGKLQWIAGRFTPVQRRLIEKLNEQSDDSRLHVLSSISSRTRWQLAKAQPSDRFEANEVLLVSAPSLCSVPNAQSQVKVPLSLQAT